MMTVDPTEEAAHGAIALLQISKLNQHACLIVALLATLAQSNNITACAHNTRPANKRSTRLVKGPQHL